MLSTPPAMNSSPSPQVIACAAMTMALSPLPQLRCKTEPADLDRQPGEQPRVARDVAASSPAWLAQPTTTSSILAGSNGLLLDDRRDHRGQHVVGPHPGERAGMAAEGRAQPVIDIGVEHGGFLLAASPRAGRPLSSPAIGSRDSVNFGSRPFSATQPSRWEWPSCRIWKACSGWSAHGTTAQHRRRWSRRFDMEDRENSSGSGSPLGRLRCERLRGGAPDLPRGRGARISAIRRAHSRPAEDPVVSRRAAEPETLHSAADTRHGRPLGH